MRSQIVAGLLFLVVSIQAQPRYFIPPTDGVLNILYWGAYGDGVHDDADITQSACDYCIANPSICTTVRLPSGHQYYWSHSVILQNIKNGSYDYFTIQIAGDAPNKSASNSFLSNVIYTGKAGFAIGIQKGRGIGIKNITLTGQYTFPASVNNANIGTLKYADWVQPGITDSRYSPYAGISIDPYENPQGGNGGSSDITIDNCAVKNWMVGIMLTANQSTQNDEMVNILDDDIEYCRDAIAIGQDQSKTINIKGLKVWASTHTIIDGVNYGRGTGGGSVFCDNWNIAGNVNQLFNVKLDRFPLSASRIYSESIFRIGTVNGGAGANFDNFQIDFLSGDGIPAPGYILSGSANFRGGCLRYYDNDPYHRMDFIGTTKGQPIKFSDMSLSTPPITTGLYGAESNFYPTPIYDNVRNYNAAGTIKQNSDTLITVPMNVSVAVNGSKWTATITGNGFGKVARIGDYILWGGGWSYIPDNLNPYPTVQIGKIISISGDSATLNDVSMNAFSWTSLPVVIDRLK